MKFLCDVHISYKLVNFINSIGFEAIHVNQILDKSRTKDKDICAYADKFNYVVITKDSDFKYSHLLHKTPKKLIKINLGNVSNSKLTTIFSGKLDLLQNLSKSYKFLLEIGLDNINIYKE